MTEQEIDLQKVQVLESSYQGLFNLRASLITGTIIGVLILLATIQFENLLPVYSTVVAYPIVFAFAFYYLHDMKKTHNEHIDFMDKLILKIEKGERLGTIHDLREKHEASTKKKSKRRHKTKT
jgi:hypothetical protein